jgi:hypothetical protein
LSSFGGCGLSCKSGEVEPFHFTYQTRDNLVVFLASAFGIEILKSKLRIAHSLQEQPTGKSAGWDGLPKPPNRFIQFNERFSLGYTTGRVELV